MQAFAALSFEQAGFSLRINRSFAEADAPIEPVPIIDASGTGDFGMAFDFGVGVDNEIAIAIGESHMLFSRFPVALPAPTLGFVGVAVSGPLVESPQ